MQDKKSTFLKKFEKYADNALTEAQKIRIGKTKYLQHHKSEIKKAYNYGYSVGMIAEFATIDLLMGSDLPKQYTFTDKEGNEVTRETKITGTEIKNICEEE
jgi:predicted SPOUT superfamily RNA methylase MTH1